MTTMDLRTSDTSAKRVVWGCHLRSKHKMERPPSSTTSQKKEIQEEDNVASKNGVLEN